MKILDVPADVILKNHKSDPDGVVLSFKDFLVQHIDTFSAIKTISQVRQAVKIVDAVESAKEAISLEDADYNVLKDAVNELKYKAGASRQLISFLDAVEKAQDAKKV